MFCVCFFFHDLQKKIPTKNNSLIKFLCKNLLPRRDEIIHTNLVATIYFRGLFHSEKKHEMRNKTFRNRMKHVDALRQAGETREEPRECLTHSRYGMQRNVSKIITTSLGTFHLFLHNLASRFLLSPRFFLTPSKFVKMATKRKFVSENSGALVPVKKPKQHEVALLNQGGAIQAVFINMFSFFGWFWCCS